jgi:cephalosporin hydroxylase
LQAYAPLASEGSYCVVFDTLIEDMAPDTYSDRPWGKGDNPHTAIQSYLSQNGSFEIDRQIHDRLLITVARDGFLRRLS